MSEKRLSEWSWTEKRNFLPAKPVLHSEKRPHHFFLLFFLNIESTQKGHFAGRSGTFYGSLGDILRAVRGHFAGKSQPVPIQFAKGTFCG
jgi:hypothetical protein